MKLVFESESSSAFMPVAVDLVERFCGVRFVGAERSAPADTVDIYHGSNEGRPCTIRIPLVDRYDATDVPALPDASGGGQRDDPAARFPFDLFAAMRFWLADEGNADLSRDAFDLHERLIARTSVQHRQGVLDTPIVNAYLCFFRAWLKAHFGSKGSSPLPEGRRCVVVLSHDVDDPIDPTFGGGLARRARLLPRHPLRSSLGMATYTARYLMRRIAKPTAGRDRHWLFEEVMEAERRLGFRSTFFFSTVPQLSEGASERDVPYDIRHERFRGLFQRISSEGWEIGLHISYNAREDWRRIAAEKQTLEDIAGVPVAGSRHHCWHMNRPFWSTLADHARAKLLYDTSVAFNEEPGYRLGVAFPFYPYNPLNEERIGTMQIPCVIMDGAFFYHPSQTVEGALRHTDRILERLKVYQGVAAIDWHVRTSYPGSRAFRSWGEAYQEILKLLAADREVLVQSCAETLGTFIDRQDSNAVSPEW